MLVAVNSASNGGSRPDNCDDWSRTDGHNLGWGSDAVAALAPHVAAGTNFLDFCNAAGDPASAANAACMSVPADDVTAACGALGGPGPTVQLLCMDLGFSQEACAAIVAAMPATIATCADLVAAQPALCAQVAAGTTAPDCAAWAPNGFIGGAPAALATAVSAMQADEFPLMAAGCAAVAASADAACADHPTGHICAHVDTTGR